MAETPPKKTPPPGPWPQVRGVARLASKKPRPKPQPPASKKPAR